MGKYKSEFSRWVRRNRWIIYSIVIMLSIALISIMTPDKFFSGRNFILPANADIITIHGMMTNGKPIRDFMTSIDNLTIGVRINVCNETLLRELIVENLIAATYSDLSVLPVTIRLGSGVCNAGTLNIYLGDHKVYSQVDGYKLTEKLISCMIEEEKGVIENETGVIRGDVRPDPLWPSKDSGGSL